MIKKLLLHLVIMLSLCELGITTDSSVPIALAKVKVTAKSNLGTKQVYVAKGKRVKVSASISGTKSKKVKYTVANKKVAAVSSKGVIKGKKAGSTKLTVYSAKNKKGKATLKIKVYKKAVKKVKQAKSSASIYLGDTLSLNVKITAPKGAAKKVYWTSSNQKVATVSAKGVVKGVKAGTAKITAVAADGSGKKSVCTVSVKEKESKKADNIENNTTAATSLQSLQAFNPANKASCGILQFSLNQSKALKESDLVIKTKKYTNGTYNKTAQIQALTTSDQKEYTIFLEESIENGTYVSLTIQALDGVNSLTTFFKMGDREYQILIAGEVGERIEQELSSENMLGAVDMKVTSGTLPEGLTLDVKNQAICGAVKSPVKNQKVVVTGTDEKGTVSTYIVNFLIGNASMVFAENLTVGDKDYNRIYKNEYVKMEVHTAGGSGAYQVELLLDDSGLFKLASDSCTGSVNVYSYGVPAGTYNLQLKFTDQENQELSAISNIRVIVSETCFVSNTILNNKTSPIIYYQNLETEKSYNLSNYVSSSHPDNIVTASLPAGYYCVYIRLGNQKQVLNPMVQITGDSEFTYRLPDYYTVTLQFLDEGEQEYNKTVLTYVYKKNEYGLYDVSQSVYYALTSSGSTQLLLLNGSYMIRYQASDGSIYTEYVTVKDADASMALKVNRR